MWASLREGMGLQGAESVRIWSVVVVDAITGRIRVVLTLTGEHEQPSSMPATTTQRSSSNKHKLHLNNSNIRIKTVHNIRPQQHLLQHLLRTTLPLHRTWKNTTNFHY